jgi:hypothetical protein
MSGHVKYMSVKYLLSGSSRIQAILLQVFYEFKKHFMRWEITC